MRNARTQYSEEIPGSEGNYNWPVKFDKTRGYVGISQTNDGGKIERVLLSPSQVKELIAFCSSKKVRAEIDTLCED